MDTTPILIAAARITHREIEFEQAQKISPVSLAAQSAKKALQKATHIAAQPLPKPDMLAAIRLFADSSEFLGHAFGEIVNYPGCVAQAMNITPKTLIYGDVGGQTPQTLLHDLAGRIYRGENDMAVLVSAEVNGLQKQAQREGWTLDWATQSDLPLDDYGFGGPFHGAAEFINGVNLPFQAYAVFEQKWRLKNKLSVAQHRHVMGRLFADLSEVAVGNPYAQFPMARSVDFLAQSEGGNYALNNVYARWLVAQDAVNQGAAIVMTSVDKARALGIDAAHWVYLYGHCAVQEKFPVARPDLAQAPSIKFAIEGALQAAGCSVSDIVQSDLYSCFPFVVLEALAALGCKTLEARVSYPAAKYSLTGGLPYYGGAGNGYSLHAIAAMYEWACTHPDDYGLVFANGGYASKQAVGIYSTAAPANWQPFESAHVQQASDKVVGMPETRAGENVEGIIETIVTAYHKGQPISGFAAVLSQDKNGMSRCFAQVPPEILQDLPNDDEMIGQRVRLQWEDKTTYLAPLSPLFMAD